MSAAADLLRLVDERISLALGGARPVEVARGTVAAVYASTRTVLVTLDAGDTTVPAVYPALPVTPEVGDEVVVLRRRDGWIQVLDVLGRDADAASGLPDGGSDGDFLTLSSGEPAWTSVSPGSGAPDDATYLVASAHAGLSAEVAVGTSPGGELGGTWASPTVDATHSGSTHAATQAAAEATAAGYVAAHTGDTSDAHDASAISFSPTGAIAATDVQAAIAELDTEKSGTGHSHEAFPVGAVFIAVVSTDPATLLGYGTWSAFGAGRVLVGRDSGDADFDTAEETGGAKTVAAAGSNATEASHTHDYTTVLNHTHTVSITDPGHAHTQTTSATDGATTRADASSGGTTYSNVANINSNTTGITASTANPAGGAGTGTTAAGSSHGHTFTGSATSIVQPYIVVYMWKRTA